eukprot:14616620-Heterocapsa_arctica.AAC.1
MSRSGVQLPALDLSHAEAPLALRSSARPGSASPPVGMALCGPSLPASDSVNLEPSPPLRSAARSGPA